MKKIIFIVLATLTISALAADLQYFSESGSQGTVWSVGPDHVNDSAELIYDPTNGLDSRGDIVHPITWTIQPTTAEEDLLLTARNIVSSMGMALARCFSDNFRVPYPTLRSSYLKSSPYPYTLTTPIAYISNSYRNTNYDYSIATLMAQSHMRTVAMALAAYRTDYNAFPPSRTALPQYVPKTLTTPIAYLSHVPEDPHWPLQKIKYQTNGSSYLLWSTGADQVTNTPSNFATSTDTASKFAYWIRGDIIYTSDDKFGESIWSDPYDMRSHISEWGQY